MDKQAEFSRMREIFFSLCKSVDTPISLGAWLRFQHNQLALAEMDIPVRDYLDADSFRLDYAVVSFLSKWKGLDTGLDLEEEALRRFKSSELSCAEANLRIKASRTNPINGFTASVISTAQRKIRRVLGPWSLFCIDSKFGWGPGATDDIPRRRALVDTKLCELPLSVSRRAFPLFRSVLHTDLHWSAVLLGVSVEDLVGPFCFLDHVFRITEECVIETVPKNAKTHRVIAKEPRANGFLQKGVGAYIRSRLKRVGINLDDQTQNQIGAFLAYDKGLATLDLKAASDSMPIELVFELLPVDWALALNDLRSHQAKMPDGQTITLNKFSSMGNGFTFELETLIFWAITSSVKSLRMSSGADVLIYGDDIICPAEIAGDVIESLAFVGFQTNKEKSFFEGNFYESCGRHFFKSKEVTPIYQKQPISSEVETLRMGNRIMRLAYRFGDRNQLRKELFGPWNAAWRIGGGLRRYQLPLGAEGDDGWLLPADYFASVKQDANLGLRCKVIVLPRKRLPAHDGALLAWTLRRGVVTESPYEGFVTSSPETTMSSDQDIARERLSEGHRWVMPSGEFGLNW